MHDYQDLINIFKSCFFETYNTLLIKGEEDPIYLPASKEKPYNAIYFAKGYYASALHECSHWFIAGPSRWHLEDFGYWYKAEGRNEEEQTQFQLVEVKPQAIEWILSKSAGFRFYVSIDNLHTPNWDSSEFKNKVYEQVKTYLEKGLPKRAEIFRLALAKFYQTPDYLNLSHFDINEIM